MTPDADRKRKWRRKLALIPGDPLAERVRLIRFWTDMARKQPLYLPRSGSWMERWALYNFRRKTMLPGLAARLDAIDTARREKWMANLMPRKKTPQQELTLS